MKTKRIPSMLAAGCLSMLSLAGVGHAAVTVSGQATSSGEFIETEIYADIEETPIVSHSFKLFYDAKQLQVVSAYHNDEVWYMSDGKRKVPYADPEVSRRGEVLFVGGRMDASDPLAGVQGRRVLLGTVVFTRLGRAPVQFEASIGREGDFASFVTVKGKVLEVEAKEVVFAAVSPQRDDQDLDGLSDAWEEKYFKDVALAFYSDDSDRDGVSHQDEEQLGSDPTDPNSHLRLEVRPGQGGVLVSWPSYEGRVYTLEAGTDPGEVKPFMTGIDATPPRNTVLMLPEELGAAMFFRVYLEGRTSGTTR